MSTNATREAAHILVRNRAGLARKQRTVAIASGGEQCALQRSLIALPAPVQNRPCRGILIMGNQRIEGSALLGGETRSSKAVTSERSGSATNPA